MHVLWLSDEVESRLDRERENRRRRMMEVMVFAAAVVVQILYSIHAGTVCSSYYRAIFATPADLTHHESYKQEDEISCSSHYLHSMFGHRFLFSVTVSVLCGGDVEIVIVFVSNVLNPRPLISSCVCLSPCAASGNLEIEISKMLDFPWVN